ncbi:MAG: hypothetical protein EU551_01210 [Promethearchaeota archaeon]|nr:MAG: hypothetical protein EU551_01210 [Candidatus Lokiarchaeota archaeon]
MALIDEDIIKDLLYPERRIELFLNIDKLLKKLAASLQINYKRLSLNDSNYIPILFYRKSKSSAPFILIQGAQHNEYNGTFGIIDYLSSKNVESLLEWCENTSGGFCFIPILNVKGFLNPIKENKYGYYTNNPRGINNNEKTLNTNRFWDKTVEYKILNASKYNIPEENRLLGNFLLDIREVKNTPRSKFIILDFHETSLPYKFRKEMEIKFDTDYSIRDHWLKGWILETVLLYKSIPFINKVSKPVVKLVRDALSDLNKDIDLKTVYFLLFTPHSRKFAQYISNKVENIFKTKLWFSTKYCFYHKYPLNGCYCTANMNRPWINAIEIEARKIFFDLEKERNNFENINWYKDHLISHLTLNSKIASKIIKLAIDYLNMLEN